MTRFVLLCAVFGCSADAPTSASPEDAPSSERVDRRAAKGDRDDGEPRVDDVIEAAIESRLRDDPAVDDARIRVDANRGRVQLFGAVASRSEKQRAIAMAWVAGVTDVDASALTVMPSAGRGAHVPPPAARNTSRNDADAIEAEPGEVVFGTDR